MDLSKLNREELTLLGARLHYGYSALFISTCLSTSLLLENPKVTKSYIDNHSCGSYFCCNSFVGVLDIKTIKPFFVLLNSIKECCDTLVIATFLSLLYSYLNISVGQNIVPDEIKGREIHHSFPMTLFQYLRSCSGVIPTISKLSPGQAAYHFLAGYHNETFNPAYGMTSYIYDPLQMTKALFSEFADNEIPSFLINVNKDTAFSRHGFYDVGPVYPTQEYFTIRNYRWRGDLRRRYKNFVASKQVRKTIPRILLLSRYPFFRFLFHFLSA